MKVSVVLLLALAAWGALVAIRRNRWRAAILLMPLAVAGILASLRLYPLLERLALWTVPPVLLLAAAALGDLTAVKRLRVPAGLAASAILLPIALSSLWLQPPPTETQALRPVIEELARRVQPGDTVYVPCGGGQLGLRFYWARAGLNAVGAEWIEGRCHRSKSGKADREAYLREASSLAGRSRVWLFQSHRPRGRSEWVLQSYLAEGKLVETIQDPQERIGLGSTRAFLFDLR